MKKYYSAEEKKQYRAKQKEEVEKALIDGVEHCYTEGNFRRYLDTIAKFHSYSINNCMLIAMQMPTATLVAGYTDWKRKFKRSVKKGEHGIRILAPAPFTVKVENVDDDGNAREDEVTYNRYRLVSVFDVSQTEGEALPEICKELEGDVEGYDVLLQKLIAVSPVEVRFENIESSAHGYYSRADNRIVVDDGMSNAQTIKTLVHEIAHSILHSDVFADIPREVKEMQAESVAYLVCSQFGIDTSEYSFEYVASWAKQDRKMLAKQMDVVRKTADMIVERVRN